MVFYCSIYTIGLQVEVPTSSPKDMKDKVNIPYLELIQPIA